MGNFIRSYIVNKDLNATGISGMSHVGAVVTHVKVLTYISRIDSHELCLGCGLANKLHGFKGMGSVCLDPVGHFQVYKFSITEYEYAFWMNATVNTRNADEIH